MPDATTTTDQAACMSDAHAIILAGGSGTRLWPLSRALLPKQLLALNGEKTLLQETLSRALRVFAPERVWVVTNEEHVFEVRKQAKEVREGLQAQVLAEPLGRNTLPAILLALDKVVGRDPQALAAVFPSDHLIKNGAAWDEAMAKACGLARAGRFVTFGVPPTKPETGYGYIHQGRLLGEGAFEVQAFKEKPDLTTAEAYAASGEHLWNSGMFVFAAPDFLTAVAEHQPALWRWWQERGKTELIAGYKDLPDISVDYGIVEKIGNQAVVRAGFDWDDLGSWEAIFRLGDKDEAGVVCQGDVLSLGCKDSLLLSRGGKLAAVGVEGVIVVQTPDATLVCPLDQVQRVKDVVGALKAQGSSLVVSHVTVRRPWGSYTVLEEGPYYKIKRIEVSPGARLSKQMHHHRSEHWVVIHGTALVEIDDVERLLVENQSVDIPKTSTHRLSNPGRTPVEIIEIQSGPYLEEDDIVRFDDVYGRSTGPREGA